MDNNANQVMKKMLQKITNSIVSNKKYSPFDKVEIFFAFGSKHRTAMCDWVYGMKIYSKGSFGLRSELVQELQMEIKIKSERFFNQSLCATDVVFVKD
jgi:hypothetical protein